MSPVWPRSGYAESSGYLSRSSGAKRKSKPPGEIAPDRMVVRSVGELARIGDADLGLRGELQIAARFDQRGVARNRNTQDIEPCADALERKRRGRRHVAEGMLPGDRHARDERHAILQEVVGRHPYAQCGIADILPVAGAGKRAHATGFG